MAVLGLKSTSLSADHLARTDRGKRGVRVRYVLLAELKRCKDLQHGKVLHMNAIESGCHKNIYVSNALISMYSRCRSMQDAWEVFESMLERTVVSWTALILGYVEKGESSVALELFNMMDCAPDRVTFVAALKACGGFASGNKEIRLQSVHRRAREHGLEKDVVVASTLVDMYSKCGDMLHAQEIFDGMKHRDVVCWTALMHGYVENGQSSLALDVFNSMDCAPNSVTFVAAFKACSNLGALEVGRRVHDHVRRLGVEKDQTVATCLVDFYGKCGDMVAAEEVFKRIRYRDLVCWTALIGGYSSLGETSQVFSVVKRMHECGLQMDGVTMLLILMACNHAGMVEEGQRYFEAMPKYGVSPTVGHYSCMVDMLGRANRLQEALSLIRSMPFEADGVIWRALLGGCRKWTNVGIGEVAFTALVILNDNDIAAACVLMRSIYQRSGMRHEAEQVEDRRQAQGGWEKTGQTCWCDGEGKTHMFVAGDDMEPKVEDKLLALLIDILSAL